VKPTLQNLVRRSKAAHNKLDFMCTSRDVVFWPMWIDDREAIGPLFALHQVSIPSLDVLSAVRFAIVLCSYLGNVTWRIKSDCNVVSVEQITI
jgi:hypothetical protein